MARLSHLALFLSAVGIVSARAGILQGETLITRNEMQGQPTGSPSINEDGPAPLISPGASAANAVGLAFHKRQSPSDASNSSALTTSTSGTTDALTVLDAALSTFSSSTTTSTPPNATKSPSPADFTTQTNGSSSSVPYTTETLTVATSTTTLTVTPPNARTTTTLTTTTLASSSRSSGSTSKPAPASALSSSKSALSTGSHTSFGSSTTDSSTSPSATSFTTVTTVVAVSYKTPVAMTQNYVTIIPATLVQLAASQNPTTTSIQCAYDHVEHISNGERVHQEQISCGTAAPAAADGLGGTALPSTTYTVTASTSAPMISSRGTGTQALSASPMSTPSASTLPVGVQEALAWLTQTTGSYSPGPPMTKGAAVKATHTSAAGADRLRLKLW